MSLLAQTIQDYLLHAKWVLVLYISMDVYRSTVWSGRSITATVIGGMESVLAVLNGDAPKLQTVRKMLGWLVTEWENAGRNLQRMVKSNWRRYGRELDWTLHNALRLNIALGRAATVFIDSPTVLRAALGRMTDQDHMRLARELFALLVIDARWSRLGGPCDRCGRYYIKKRTDQKRYCGRRCAHLASAVSSTRRRLDAEKAEKLRRAIQAAKNWRTARTQLGWKEWVSRTEPGITPKFLTRAVTNNELEAPTPKEGVKHAKQRAERK